MNRPQNPPLNRVVMSVSVVLFAAGSYALTQVKIVPEKLFLASSMAAVFFFLTTVNLTIWQVSVRNRDEKSNSRKVSQSEPPSLVHTLIEHGAMKALAKTLLNLNARFDQRLCLMVAGVDGGHTDEPVLVALSGKFTQCLRETDVVGLADTKKLMVILPNTSKDEGYRLAEQLRSEVNNHTIGERNVTLSIGCIEIRKKEELDEALKRATLALEYAQQGGANQTVVS